jgi:hypothetical protein
MNLIAALVLLLVVFSVAQLWDIALMGFQPVDRVATGDAIRAGILSIATVLGVVSRGIYDELERIPSRHIGFRRLIKLATASKPFWVAILISPILMLAFYESVREISNGFLVGVMAYQNGFFFRSILAARGEPKAK